MFYKQCVIVLLIIILAACSAPQAPATPTPAATADRAELPLQFDDLMHGFAFSGPVDEAALTPPQDAALPAHRRVPERHDHRLRTLAGHAQEAEAYPVPRRRRGAEPGGRSDQNRCGCRPNPGPP